MLPTRALSLIQPWAWAVVHGPKDIENRVWWTELRGPFWLAASAQVTRRYYDAARDHIERLAPGIVVPALDELDYGCIIGSASITDCILPGGYASTDTKICREAAGRFRANGQNWGRDRQSVRVPQTNTTWHFVEQYGYVLANRTALAKPVPCKGKQRWWTVPANVLEQLREAA